MDVAMERNLTQKNNFGKTVQESDTKNSSNGSSICIIRERIPSTGEKDFSTQMIIPTGGGQLDVQLHRSPHNFLLKLAEEFNNDLFDDENDLLPHLDNVFESEGATFMTTLTNKHVLEKSGNQSEPDYDEEDPKQKRNLKLSFRGVKMFGVVDKRAYVENYLLCNACNFRIPTPKKGFSTFLDIASGMIAMRKHFKALHKEEYKALKSTPPLPKEPPKSKSKKGRKQREPKVEQG
ncbi:unnamed protein product [Orchesella dallaii]|uniref:Uncharacterized protein n=1 Tax=Orchesella dallaii TaxID=48710 RepID=A0ABP1QJZ1_9HEXA